MTNISFTARFLHLIKKEFPLSLIAVLSLVLADNQASAYEVYDIINVENLNFPMEGFPTGGFYDGTITADKCVLGNYVSYPTSNLITSGTTYGIRQLDLADNLLCFNNNTSNKLDGTNPKNSVLYNTNNVAKLKSVTLLTESSSGSSWYWHLYVPLNGSSFGPNKNYGFSTSNKQYLSDGIESTYTLSQKASDDYKWFCIVVPVSSPKLKYIQLCWIIDATDPELYYYGPGLQNGQPCNVEYGSDMIILPELSNPLKLDLTYNSSNTDVATIDDKGNVTINKIGQTVISANPKDATGYGPSQARYLLNVQPPKPTFNILTSGVTTIEKEEGAFYLEYGSASSVDISFNVPTDGSTIWYRYKEYSTNVTESDTYSISPATYSVGNQSEYKKYDSTSSPITVNKGNNSDVTFFSEKNGAKSNLQKIITGFPTGKITISDSNPETEPEYFNLEGNRISHPEKGIYIVRHHGTTKKVIK